MKETKFKVGDKVRVKGLVKFSSPGKRPFIGDVFTIDNIAEDRNGSIYDWCYHLKDSGHYWCEDELEFVHEFSKSDLKPGMIVKFRNDTMWLFTGHAFVSNHSKTNICYYDDCLKNKISKSLDVAEVYGFYDDNIYDIKDIFRTDKLARIWKREEEEPITDMTVAEIEEKLGYKVKVIADKE